MMDIIAVVNLIIAVARALDIDPEELAELFNERDKNQRIYDQLLQYQRILDQEAPHDPSSSV
jgi:hypothetical protein